MDPASGIVVELAALASLGAEDVYGHREVMAPGYTVCPGYDMDGIRDRVAGYLRAAR